MLDIADADIGGARVRRTFVNGDRQMKMGDELTAEEVIAINLPNRRALADSNFIEIYPRSAGMAAGEKFIVGLGKDKYNVIEGRIVNSEPLTRDAAEKLLRQ